MNGVSFIIPVYNGESTIEETINSILYQNLDLPFEIIVVNNGSTDNTLLILKKYSHIKILNSLKVKNRSHARNFGANNSKYSILAFIDCDVQITSDWTASLLKVLKHPFAAAQTTIQTKYRNKKSVNHYLNAHSPFQTIDSCSFLVFKNIFLDVFGFEESLARWEDSHFTMKLLAHGHSLIVINPAMAIKNEQRNIFQLYKRIFETGLSEGLVLRTWFSFRPSILLLFKFRPEHSFSKSFIQLLGQYFSKNAKFPELNYKSGWTFINKKYAISKLLNILISPDFICLKSLSNSSHHIINSNHPDFQIILNKVMTGEDFWDDLFVHIKNEPLIITNKN